MFSTKVNMNSNLAFKMSICSFFRSPVPFSGARHDRNCHLLDQHCPLSLNLGSFTYKILLLSLHFQGIFPASHGVPIRPRIGGVFRDNPNQHLPVRPREGRSVATGSCRHFILD